MKFGPVVPVLRMFDEAAARDFYGDFLGFTVTFEHRFEPGLPLYMGLRRGDAELHISGHNGDGSPGANIRIQVDDVDAFQQELLAKQYKYARPGVVDQEWGARECSVGDPFHNRLTFWSPIPKA